MRKDLQRRRLLARLLLLGLMSSAAEAATFTVINLNDGGDGSLRKAISGAEGNIEEDTIVFDVSGTIVLATTLPTITKADGLTINGAGQTVTISGNHAVQVMRVSAGGQLTLEFLTIANGKTGGNGGGIFINQGTVTVTNSTFSGNEASYGGGIYKDQGTLTVTNSTFYGNQAPGYGGGIANSEGTATVTNSTFYGNQAVRGGGIYSYQGTLTVTNSTLSGNAATYAGGGIDNYQTTIYLTNSILANSPQGSDCFNDSGTLNAFGINLIEDGSCSVPNALSGDPLLGPLKDNGGPTETMALLPESKAFDAVTDGTCPPPATDQRGVSRPQGPYCDIGAFEVAYVGCTTTANLRSGGSGDTLRITNQGPADVPFTLQFVNAQGAVQGQTVAKSLTPGQSSITTVSALLQQARIGVFNSAWLLQVRTEPKTGITATPLQSVYLPSNGTPAVLMIYTCAPEGSAN